MLYSFLAGFGTDTSQKKLSQRGKNGDCGRFLGPLRGPSQRGAELGRRVATERVAVPLRIVPTDPAPELLDEAGGGPVRPVPAVPELLLEQAEEALHRRVVRVAALGGLDWLH